MSTVETILQDILDDMPKNTTLCKVYNEFLKLDYPIGNSEIAPYMLEILSERIEKKNGIPKESVDITEFRTDNFEMVIYMTGDLLATYNNDGKWFSKDVTAFLKSEGFVVDNGGVVKMKNPVEDGMPVVGISVDIPIEDMRLR